MDHRLDPLGDLEVKRVLAFARAREQYPAVPRGLLLDYCQAAWQAALVGGGDDDIIGRFERALMLVAWTHRRSPHLNLRDLVDQVIPQVALRPFMSPDDRKPPEKPDEAPAIEVEPAVQPDAPRPPARRLIPRVPFASPIPLGAAVAAGFIGVTVLGQSGALPVAPFAPAGDDDASRGRDSHHGDRVAAVPAAPSTGGGGGSSAAAGTPAGLAAAPQAASAFRASAATAGGGRETATAPAEPAQPVATPAASQAPPAEPAPAAPVVSAPPPGEGADQQSPDTGGVEQLAQLPEEHPSKWKQAAEVQLPAPEPVPAPDEAAPEDLSAPDVTAPESDEGEKHATRGHPDHFDPIDLNETSPAPDAEGDDAEGDDAPAPDSSAEDDTEPADDAAPAPAPAPAQTQAGPPPQAAPEGTVPEGAAPEPGADQAGPEDADTELQVPPPAEVGPPPAPAAK